MTKRYTSWPTTTPARYPGPIPNFGTATGYRFHNDGVVLVVTMPANQYANLPAGWVEE